VSDFSPATELKDGDSLEVSELVPQVHTMAQDQLLHRVFSHTASGPWSSPSARWGLASSTQAGKLLLLLLLCLHLLLPRPVAGRSVSA
jgi:hypothetical protein